MSEVSQKRPVILSADETELSPADAPVIEDRIADAPAMIRASHVVSARRSLAMRVFLWVLGIFIGFALSLAFWDFVAGLMARNIWLGRFGVVLLGVLVACALLFFWGELRGYLRLRHVDDLRDKARHAHQNESRDGAQKFGALLVKSMRHRGEMEWHIAKYKERKDEHLDASAALLHIETELVAPLDRAALGEIEAAAKTVAGATIIVPLALLDVLAALTTNMRMIRRISEIYGARAGVLGSWRLFRMVFTHLLATGAVAIGDDMITSLAGGGVLSKISRRFGEGVINGALTVRVGIATMEVCRPMAFSPEQKPRVTAVISSALTGLFPRGG
ncbi:TIGR01620 family protein [Amylibacter marinus]|uniref:TIGR01620 family protein n=1 Tax=Amylibacter marinus TaxID=1475483 RepID=A0ABQ5VYD7_9RHOB|nr:TIGR01620 family protein [Amylibacter marinus]GLQ36101.1 TIGR01620 family protein [Amylibacter marinus]